MIHDQSASGAAIFVEPYKIVELNNELRQAKSDEKTKLTGYYRNLERVAHDERIWANPFPPCQNRFILAKGKLSHDMDGQVQD